MNPNFSSKFKFSTQNFEVINSRWRWSSRPAMAAWGVCWRLLQRALSDGKEGTEIRCPSLVFWATNGRARCTTTGLRQSDRHVIMSRVLQGYQGGRLARCRYQTNRRNQPKKREAARPKIGSDERAYAGDLHVPHVASWVKRRDAAEKNKPRSHHLR
jgi:hypothetical protein